MHQFRLLREDGKVKLYGSLREAMQLALNTCLLIETNEEEGGFIPRKKDEFKYFRVNNCHSGTKVAAGLYEPDRKQYGETVIASYGDGFCNWGSFHTHPFGCRALPSLTDLTRLFNGQPNNFIWSPSLHELNWFEIVSQDTTETIWRMKIVDLENLKNVS